MGHEPGPNAVRVVRTASEARPRIERDLEFPGESPVIGFLGDEAVPDQRSLGRNAGDHGERGRPMKKRHGHAVAQQEADLDRQLRECAGAGRAIGLTPPPRRG